MNIQLLVSHLLGISEQAFRFVLSIMLASENLVLYQYHSYFDWSIVVSAIAKLWKQPRSPTTDELIKKIWCSYTMEFYSTTKKNKILLFADKWIELENIILNEVSQVQKAKCQMFSLICRI
jgi:hypothetical protein